jgi:gamma-glutamylcyclotransferase (GGCT)/AIG2-like uncharacterized protein YtfP
MHVGPPSDLSAQQHVFAYGTLVEPNRLDAVLGRRHAGERLRARLAGFERISTDAYPYPYIVDRDGYWVEGVLLMDLSAYDIEVLDRYEEVAKDVYQRRLVEVEAWGCGPGAQRFQAHTYVAGAALLQSTMNEPNCNT